MILGIRYCAVSCFVFVNSLIAFSVLSYCKKTLLHLHVMGDVQPICNKTKKDQETTGFVSVVFKLCSSFEKKTAVYNSEQ